MMGEGEVSRERRMKGEKEGLMDRASRHVRMEEVEMLCHGLL